MERKLKDMRTRCNSGMDSEPAKKTMEDIIGKIGKIL